MIRHFDLALPAGITLACRGAGEGRARVLLLHGFPEAAFVWDEVMQRVAPHAVCVAPNLRGYVGSSAPADLSAYRAKQTACGATRCITSSHTKAEIGRAHV